MTRNLLTSAIFAGLAAGVLAAALQFVFVIPVLLEGELYESGQRVHFATDGSPQSDRGAPGIGNDFARHTMTLGFDLVTYTGYGLILMGLMALGERNGIAISARAGLVWGLAGFIAVQLAPALGQPPDLPGTPAGAVGPRQAWWAATILCSAVGLALLAFARSWLAAIGVVLLALPHLIGAPQLDTYWGVAPPELSAEFATLSLGAAAAGWTALGFFCGLFWERARDA
ncbi:MAG: CbtA family protein [Rhodobacter sp.]|nr:CbtA family protein [Rhodobacter sp.]